MNQNSLHIINEMILYSIHWITILEKDILHATEFMISSNFFLEGYNYNPKYYILCKSSCCDETSPLLCHNAIYIHVGGIIMKMMVTISVARPAHKHFLRAKCRDKDSVRCLYCGWLHKLLR